MELQQLRYFSAVAERLHFTKAAAELNIAQPHLSREIRRLERDLGVKLFDRTTRQVQLTEAGAAFLDHVRSVFLEVEQAKGAAQAVHSGQVGKIVGAFAGSVTYSWLPFLIREYRGRFPNVDVEIRSEMLTGTQVEALIKGRIDFGLLRPPVENLNISTMTLDIEPLIVAVPSTHRLATIAAGVPISELAKERFITYLGSASTTQKAVLQTCLSAGFVPTIVQAVVDTHSLISLVAAGMGIALVPRSAQHFTVAGVIYLPLAENEFRIPLLLAWRKTPERQVVRNFVGLVQELAARADANWPGPPRRNPPRMASQ